MSGRAQYATWRSERSALPRTPHSARHQDIVDMLDNQQSEPLLQSSKEAVFPQHQLDYEYHSKAKRNKRPSIGLVLGSIGAVVLLFLFVLSLWKPSVLHEYVVGENGELLVVVEDDVEPDEPPVRLEAVPRPAPAKVNIDPLHDENGHGSNTIDYSEYSSFPLTPTQYDAECWKLHQGPHRHAGYWATPQHGPLDVAHHSTDPKVCTSTITYMLDGEVGLAADLAYMAQVAGLARERNRTFFVMDKWWNRGRWEDYFDDVHKAYPGPEPDCLPPSPEEYVACPRVARHWIVGSRTVKFHLTHEFMDEHEDPFKMDLLRQRPMFDWAVESLRDTIRPNAATKRLIAAARHSLAGVPDGGYIGVHMRRGDQLARTWKYHKGYVPVAEFVAGIRALDGGVRAIWAASDTPAALEELAEAAGHSVQMFNLSSAGAQVRALMPGADDAGYVQKEWRLRAAGERARLTRGMIVDLALLSGLWLEPGQGPSATVCTYGSNVCRLAAIGLGWERAFDKKRWVDVDAKGTLAPIWAAFNLVG